MSPIATFNFELVRQEGRWEPCDECPAGSVDHTPGTLCHYLSNLANDMMGGFASCGGGATWRVSADKRVRS